MKKQILGTPSSGLERQFSWRVMFPKMQEIVPEGTVGVAKVEHFTVSKRESMMTSFRPGDYVPEGCYARLYVDGALMMSDTPMERRSNYGALRNANGKVLIAGLGLGMILAAILQKPEVKSVTVIEKYQDVIDLVGSHFTSPKLTIICADIFEWKPPSGARYDAIYFDIWTDICTDNLEQIATLHQRFKCRLNRNNPKFWMGSWEQEYLRYQRQRDRRSGW